MQNDIHDVIKKVGHVSEKTNHLVEPVRLTLFKRFPILATLLVTFGVTATLYGMERMISEVVWLNNNPVAIFVAGITALMVAGKLHQKLG